MSDNVFTLVLSHHQDVFVITDYVLPNQLCLFITQDYGAHPGNLAIREKRECKTKQLLLRESSRLTRLVQFINKTQSENRIFTLLK